MIHSTTSASSFPIMQAPEVDSERSNPCKDFCNSNRQNPLHHHDETKPAIRRKPTASQRSRKGLIRFAKDYTSQNGEDGILERLFELLSSPNDSSQGAQMANADADVHRHWCVDVGAWDGQHLSNTHTLLTQRGWRGILIEADAQRFSKLKALHEPLQNITIQSLVSCQQDSPNHLLVLLKSTPLPRDFQFLCIDVDGIDYWLLYDLLQSGFYQPRVVCIEFNPSIPNDVIYIPPRSDETRHGCSLAALVECMKHFGYVLVETTLYNAFFVQQQLYHRHLRTEVPDTSIEVLHEVTMGTQVYQLYDGTIKLHGCKKLLWHRHPIDERKLQVLPESQRKFPFAPNTAAPVLVDAVDMSPYCLGGEVTVDPSLYQAKRKAASDALWEQLGRDGFAFVRGTGMSAELCRSALYWTHQFLHEADESVRRSTLCSRDRARRGYAPMCTENFASLIGVEGAPNDLVRKFRMGPITRTINDTAMELRNDADDADDAPSSLFAENVWPKEWEPEFQQVLERYYQECNAASLRIVEAIRDAVVKNHPHLTKSVDVLLSSDDLTRTTTATRHSSILTALGYRVGTRHRRKEKSPLVAAHTDVGIVTVLIFDGGGKESSCAVLQRAAGATRANSWVDVHLPPIVDQDDPVFVVNIGDCLSDLTDHNLPSTLHRVIPVSRSTEPRNCLAMFVGLDPTSQLQLPSGETLLYEDWRKQRIKRAQQVLRHSKGIDKIVSV